MDSTASNGSKITDSNAQSHVGFSHDVVCSEHSEAEVFGVVYQGSGMGYVGLS